jgi:hypothetical protein
MSKELFLNYTQLFITVVSVAAAAIIVIWAFTEIRKVKISLPGESPLIPPGAEGDHDRNIELQLHRLDNYYALAMNQSRISFWFSILFASAGFVIIIISAFLYAGNNLASTVISLVSGTVIDAVSALFFVQSRNARQNLNNFFQRLREDNQYSEARSICDSIESSEARDALKIKLALKLSGIPGNDQTDEQVTAKKR